MPSQSQESQESFVLKTKNTGSWTLTAVMLLTRAKMIFSSIPTLDNETKTLRQRQTDM